jgi:ribonuclease BN (tRNA processing enzyme)
MIKEILCDGNAFSLCGIIALLAFFATFTIESILAFFLTSSHAEHMAQLPLEENDSTGDR